MKLEQSFEVAAPLERVWEALIDVERVAPCLPGASVTGRNDDGSYNGEFKVKIGPTSASYSGKLNMEKVDTDGHTATMDAAGTDKRGQGGAKATIVSSVAEAGAGATTVTVDTDYHITGRLARFGRGGMIEEISNRLLGEFAKNLQAMVAGGDDHAVPAADADASETAATPTAAEPQAGDRQGGDRQVGDRDPQASHSDPEPAADPDAAIEGATPVADPEPAATTESSTPPPPVNEPLDAGSLVGGAVADRVKSNPLPIAALILGFLLALRVLRRRD